MGKFLYRPNNSKDFDLLISWKKLDPARLRIADDKKIKPKNEPRISPINKP